MLVPAFLYRSDNLVCDGKLKSQSGSKDFIVERQFQVAVVIAAAKRDQFCGQLQQQSRNGRSLWPMALRVGVEGNTGGVTTFVD